MATSIQVTFDCRDPNRLATFWAEALGYQIQDPPPGFGSWPEFLATHGIPEEKWSSASAIVDPAGAGPRIYFQQVPEPKVVKNRVHLDVNVGGGHSTPADERRTLVRAAAARLTAAGASQVREFEEYDGYWIVMEDPEGNEFCLQ
ncbi:MAG: VOC family protein [Chloroflexi bacterium]|nr:VOC family protein [Chloroflexota bacterium]